MIDEDVGKPAPPFGGKELFDVFFDLVRVLVLREAQPEGEPLHVGVHHHARDIKGRAQDAVGGLPAHPGELYQFLHGGGDLAAVLFQKTLAASPDGPGLVPEKPGGPDILFQFRDRHGQEVFRPPVLFEEVPGDPVHLFVRALGREDGGDEELKRGPVLEGGLLPRVEGIQDLEDPGRTFLFLFQAFHCHPFLRVSKPPPIRANPGQGEYRESPEPRQGRPRAFAGEWFPVDRNVF